MKRTNSWYVKDCKRIRFGAVGKTANLTLAIVNLRCLFVTQVEKLSRQLDKEIQCLCISDERNVLKT